MQGIVTLPSLIIKTLRGRIAATKTNLKLKVRYACYGLSDMIISMLSRISSQKHFLDRLSQKQDQPTGLANVELYEAIMYPDDKKELVNVVYDLTSGTWKLDAKPTDKQLGRLINREDRVLLLCPRKLVEVLDKGRHGTSVISVADAYSKWQEKHVLVNRLSAPDQNKPCGNMPDFGTFMQGEDDQDLRLSSHDIFHIRNLKFFLLRCSEAGSGAPAAASSILKSWMITMPQVLSILEDKAVKTRCKMTYWALFRRGRVGSTVYLQLHGADDTDDSYQALVEREPPVQTADTQTIAALRLSTQAVNNRSFSVPNGRSWHGEAQYSTAGAQAANDQALADQTAHPYGKDLNINDPQTYFERFGCLTSPQQTANILMALSFFLRPPELDWENLPLAKEELKKTLLGSPFETPEVFIVSRKQDHRTASLSQVARVATAAVHRQFGADGNGDDKRRALGMRARWQAASNDETDLFRSPIYHQRQVFSLGSPVYIPQGGVCGASEQRSMAMDSTTTTPRAGRPLRFASQEGAGTVWVKCKQAEDGGVLTGTNGNGVMLNPEAPSFTSLSMPAKGILEAEENQGLSMPTSEWPSISLEDAKSVGVLGCQNCETPSESGYTSWDAGLSIDGQLEAERESPKSPPGSTHDTNSDLEEGGAERGEMSIGDGHAYC